MADATNSPEEGRGLPGYDRILRATKGADRPSTAGEFTPTAPPTTTRKRTRFSVGRILMLFFGLVVFFFVLNIFLLALRGG